MSSLAVFCTNAINIVAGINGVEVFQCIIISLFLIGNSLFNISITSNNVTLETHLFCLYFMIPFLFVSLGLLYYNWYLHYSKV